MRAKDRVHGPVSRFFAGVMLTANVLVGIGLIASAYSGRISPVASKYAALLMYTFPAWLLAIVLLLVVDLIWWRRAAVIAGISMVICLPQIADFTPVHLPRGPMDEEQRARSFTLMTYNVMQFANQNKDIDICANQQLEYIIGQSPDIVCIEEARCLSPDANSNHITQGQLADLNRIYPYIYLKRESFALLSKFKAEPIEIGFPICDYSSGDAACWRVYIHGQVVNLFVAHLRSFALSFDERYLFRDITDIEGVNKSMLREAKSDLIPKVITSSIDRTSQYEWLVRCLKKYGGDNTILCGDLNDPVGSYGLYILERDAGLKQVYPEVGFGPMITYNANNFYFRIDHVLYRGDLYPYSMTRGDIKASDHYPLTTTFVLK